MPTPARTSDAAVRRLADRLEPQLRRDFLAAVAKLQGRISLAAIAQAVQRGEMTAEITLAVNAWPSDLRRAVRTLNTVFAQAGRETASTIRGPLSLRTSFTLTNPFAVQAADTNTALLVREVTAETRRAIQRIIGRAFVESMPPRVAARLIKPLIGLTTSQAQAVLNHRDRLITRGLRGDVLIARTTRYANRLLTMRAENIARTETIRASIDGQLAIWRRARSGGLIDAFAQKRWSTTPDDRLCPRCAPLNGIEVPLDAAFPGGVLGPPLHPRCRCALVLVTATRSRRKAA